MAIFRDLHTPFTWHGQCGIYFVWVRVHYPRCNCDSPSTQSVCNLEASVITCLWPNAWTGSRRRGTSSDPQGLFMGVKYCYGPLPISNHSFRRGLREQGIDPSRLWMWRLGGKEHHEHRLLHLIMLLLHCSALTRGLQSENLPWV